RRAFLSEGHGTAMRESAVGVPPNPALQYVHCYAFDFFIFFIIHLIISMKSFIVTRTINTPKNPAITIATFSKNLSIPNLVHKSKTDIIITKHIKAVERISPVFLSLDFIWC